MLYFIICSFIVHYGLTNGFHKSDDLEILIYTVDFKYSVLNSKSGEIEYILECVGNDTKKFRVDSFEYFSKNIGDVFEYVLYSNTSMYKYFFLLFIATFCLLILLKLFNYLKE